MIKEVEEIISTAFNSVSNAKFYNIKDNGKIEFFSNDFIKFLENHGYRTVKIGGNIELVQIDGCIVKKITPSDVKIFVKDYVEGKPEIQKYIIDRTGLFSINYLDALKRANLKMHRDNSKAAYFYYKNGVVEVTKDEIKKPVPYSEFKRLIWEDHINNREFNENTDIVNNIPVFSDFINKLSNNDKERFTRLCTLIGYCLHDYRTTANTKAIIINDEEVNDQPEGGSGKSLLVKALSKIRKSIDLDGKRFDAKADFAWQNVNDSIGIVHIDDAARGFQFEDLFSVITSGFVINRKNKPQYILPIEDAPIIVLTTNTIIKGISGSFARRQYNIDIHPYFNSNHTPIDEYKQIFFEEWDKTEWAKFDMFMMKCVQMYLQKGVTECIETDSRKKDAIRATCISFVEWFEEAKTDFTSYDGMGTNVAKLQYLNSVGQKNMNLPDKRFLLWVQSYCKIFNIKFIKLDKQRPRGFRIALNDNGGI